MNNSFLLLFVPTPLFLILVLMEDALRAGGLDLLAHQKRVLILVLMEDALRVVVERPKRKKRTIVLILVLMEDALREGLDPATKLYINVS